MQQPAAAEASGAGQDPADGAAPPNVADLVRAAAARGADRPAFLFASDRSGADRLSWGEVDDRVDRFAGGLAERGLRPGDRLVLHLGNRPEFPVAYFGALRAGLVVVPANPGFAPRELRHLLADSGARALVTASEATAGTAGSDIEHVVLARDVLGGSGGRPAEPVPAASGGEDLAVLSYTSGTSGSPRGAMLSHRALLANLDQCAAISPPVLGPEDVVLLVLPLFHVYGLNPGLGMVARQAAAGVLVERFDPHDTLAVMARHEVTNVLGAPPMYVAWSMAGDVEELAAAFDHVRLALSGAAPLPRSVLRRLLETTGHYVFEGYGLTETGPVLTSTLMSQPAKPDSIGRAIPGVELRLVDEGAPGEPVEEGDPGEIVVRGPNLFSGYWPDGSGGPRPDGWFATGDVAYADEDGDLFLVDRRTELILVSGFNVYPREVEQVIAAHPQVAEAAVIGIPHPYTGETVKAVVVPVAAGAITADELIAHCERSLARFKCPTAVEFVAELPHSATGKVRKGLLRKGLLREGLLREGELRKGQLRDRDGRR